MANLNNIYHYTSFDKFKCILQNGTLRFKESTQSNDLLDTKGLENALKQMKSLKSKDNEFATFINFVIDYFKREQYKTHYTSLVSCFSLNADSRLLWDAYTIHRPSNIECAYEKNKFCFPSNLKYNGVCIAFKKDKIKSLINSYVRKACDKAFLEPVNYGKGIINSRINDYLKKAALDSFKMQRTAEGQKSSLPPIYMDIFSKPYEFKLRDSLIIPALKFIFTIEERSPFYKHEFWKEEEEVRAALLIHNGNMKTYRIPQDSSGTKYFDVPISSDCIDYIILGPEFGDEEKKEILNANNYKLDFSNIKQTTSIGTGVIVSK